ncbi:hypothetical protein V565_136830, partial [Rhizoctonia solani 123E]
MEVRVSPTPIIRAQVLNNVSNNLQEATKNLAAPRPPIAPSTFYASNARMSPSADVANNGAENIPTNSPIGLSSAPLQTSPQAVTLSLVARNYASPIGSINSSLRELLSSTPSHAVSTAGTPARMSPQAINSNRPQVITRPIPPNTLYAHNSTQPPSIPPNVPVLSHLPRQGLGVYSVDYSGRQSGGNLSPEDQEDTGENADDEDEEAMEEEMISSVYEDNNDARWHKLYGMIRQMATTQTNLALDVQRLNSHVQDPSKRSEQDGHGGGGTYVSPPDPPKPINWDQSSLIRGMLGSMIKRTSNRDPLPHPPPASLRAPTEENFGIRGDENERSPFNQMAAKIVAEKIERDQPDLLTTTEKQELRAKVTKHIKYLCRRYKDDNRPDAEEFNQKRLKRCSAGSRKRQLYETRLQTLDRFPAALGKHRRLIVHLGVDGTSSDEEDYRNPGIYKIKRKPELSTKVTQLKRNLDFVYALYFKGPGSKGSQ